MNFRVQLQVRIHRGRLDRELADGCTDGPWEARAWRARQLADQRTRRSVARSLRRIVADARSPWSTMRFSAVPLRCSDVMAWHEGLLGLADRLLGPEAVSAGAVARVLVLICDGTGPLYHEAADRTLGEAIWWIADGLETCPPHDWRCPVVMKLDPAHVAWTCARCGAIAVTDDLAVRPA
jgi:hypothetical protein